MVSEETRLNAAFGRQPDETITISAGEMTANLANAFGFTQQQLRELQQRGVIKGFQMSATLDGKVLAEVTLQAKTTWTRIPGLTGKPK